jgi:hypothetical protein
VSERNGRHTGAEIGRDDQLPGRRLEDQLGRERREERQRRERGLRAARAHQPQLAATDGDILHRRPGRGTRDGDDQRGRETHDQR